MAAPATPAISASPREGALVSSLALAFELALRRLNLIARHRAACVAGVIAFSIILRLALGFILPHPRPYVGDEFGYLLSGETLAAGRLANPQHPMWPFFESPYVVVHPVYVSQYQPGQGAFLALGDRIFGDPSAGVFLSVALFAGAVCWALQAYVPGGWALLGGLFVALIFGPGHYFTESYWGGAVAALGATLAIGAFRRITALRAQNYGWVFGLGALLLLDTRPYEGGALAACLVALMLWHAWKRHRLHALIPVAISLAVALILMACFNWRVTGNPLQPPYLLHRAEFGPAPNLWIVPARAAKTYGNPDLQRTFTGLLKVPHQLVAYPLPKRIVVILVRLFFVLAFGVGPFAFLPILFLPAVIRQRSVRLLAAAGCVAAAFLLLDTYMYLHYAAPLLALLVVLSFVVLHRMTRARAPHRASGILMAGIAVLLMFGNAAERVAKALVGENINYPARPPFLLDRDAVIRRVDREPGQHVVFVRYAPDHDFNIEWVYNGPDIDRSRVVWAHDLGDARDRLLMNYYKGRHFWLLQPDLPQPALSLYKSRD